MKDTVKIYVDIESILDIRQAILSKLMDLETLATYLNSDEYNFRTSDIFPVDMNAYNEINSQKDIDLLSRSTITYIVNILDYKIVTLEKRNVYYGKSKMPEIVLNVHPFDLNEEQMNIIQNLLFVKLENKCFINVVNLPISEITPYFIKSSDIVVCFIYNFSEWLNCHLDALSKTKLIDTIFYFPSIYKIKEDSNELEKIKKIGFKDVFSYLEFLLSSLTTISFLPIVFYSNIITSSILIEKYNKELKYTRLGDLDGDSSEEI